MLVKLKISRDLGFGLLDACGKTIKEFWEGGRRNHCITVFLEMGGLHGVKLRVLVEHIVGVFAYRTQFKISYNGIHVYF